MIALLLWLRVSNLLLFVGIFRSGGDTRFAFFLDVGAIWFIGLSRYLSRRWIHNLAEGM